MLEIRPCKIAVLFVQPRQFFPPSEGLPRLQTALPPSFSLMQLHNQLQLIHKLTSSNLPMEALEGNLNVIIFSTG